MAVLSHLGPTKKDLRAVGATLVVAARLVGAAMVPAALVGAALGELEHAAALLLGAAVPQVVTAPLRVHLDPPSRLTWSQAFTAAGLAWPVGAVVAAVPLVLSGHYVDPLHALVDAMAGLTTTGADFVGDLDHLPVSVQLWRHTLHPLGAVAALLLVATIRMHGETYVATSNVAEAGEHRILPRRGRSLRDAVLVVALWSTIGTVVLTVLAAAAGASPGRALLHGVTLATSAVSTGGFTLTSASAGALHSPAVQTVLAVLMLIGATSLVLHRSAMANRVAGIARELDVRVFAASGAALTLVVLLGLERAGAQTTVSGLVGQGLFTTIAAHTTTGMSPGSGALIATNWGDLAPAALVAAMGVGGMTGSAAGGVGTLRVGIILKGIVRDVRRLLLPESAVVVETYQQRRRHVLTDQHVRAAATVLLLVLSAVFLGSVAHLATTTEGDLPEALFAATSAVTTTGLSLGFIGSDAAAIGTTTSGLLMWFGRVEFLAVLAAAGLFGRGLPGVGGDR